MKFFVLACLVAYAAADVSHIVNKDTEKSASIVKHELDTSPNGDYQYNYETSNGISASAQGRIVDAGGETPSQAVQGQASWTAPGGEPVDLQYIADENGYQPQGSHIPTPPPIPELILRALEYIRSHPPPPERK